MPLRMPISIASLARPDTTLPSASEILDTLFFRAGFNTSVVVAGTTLLGLAAGIVGVFALLRKRSLVADALSHATLPGIAIAFLVASSLGIAGRSVPVLLLGAAMSGIVGVLSIQAILRWSRLHEDAAIGIVLSVFFGAGVIGLSYIQANAPTGSGGLKAFIYGQAATMRPSDVLLMGGIAAISTLAGVLFLKELALVCFNDAFARVDGWPVSLIDLIMMGLVVLVTVAGLQAVGLILVIALLIIPPVAARFWTERLWKLLLISGAIGAVSGYLGSVVSALLPGKPTGAVIVITAGLVFVVSMIAAPARGVVAVAIRRARLHLRIAGDHLVEHAHELGTDSLSRAQVIGLATLRGWSILFRAVLFISLRRTGLLANAVGTELVLTERGQRRGARVARNHALWEQYLISYADIAPSHVDWSVDQVEHVLSDELVDELERELVARGIRLAPLGGGGLA